MPPGPDRATEHAAGDAAGRRRWCVGRLSGRPRSERDGEKGEGLGLERNRRASRRPRPAATGAPSASASMRISDRVVAAAAAHQPAPRRLRQKRAARRRRPRAVKAVSVAAPSAGGQRRDRVERDAKVVAVERLRRRPAEVGMASSQAMTARRRPARAPPARRPRRTAAPVRRSTQSSISALPGPVSKASSGGRRIASADPGDVGDAADVEHRERPRQLPRQRRVIERHQRRALAAGRDVGGAEVVDHGDAGQRPPAARRRRSARSRRCSGPVQDRLAVKADDVDVRAACARLGAAAAAPPRHGGRSARRSTASSSGCRPLAAEQAAQPAAERRADRAASSAGPKPSIALAVGVDQRGVDAVERGAAHQPDGRAAAGPSSARPMGSSDPSSGRRSPPRAVVDRPQRARCAAKPAPASVVTADRSRHDRPPLRVPAHRRRARLPPPVHRPATRSTRWPPNGRSSAYIGFDCTAPSLHVGSLVSIMLLRRAAADRPQADRADGRRHDQDRRSLRHGRGAQAADRRRDRRQHGRHPAGVRQLPRLRRRADRRDHGQQRRLARRASPTSRSCATTAGTSRSTAC